MVSIQDLGPVTAYAIAVKYGFSGTEQEWANAVDAQRQAASASATSAANSASEALTAANSAKASATSISSSVISANSSADSATASATSAANSLTAMQNTVAHMPVIGDNGNWESWNGTAYVDSGKPWKGEKGDTGLSFEYGESYDTLTALQAAYPSGDTKGHLVGTTTYVWDGTTWKESIPDLSGYLKSADAENTYVPQTRTINSKPLNSDITLTAADVSAVPSSHTSETVSTENGVHGLRYYSEKLQAKDTNGDWQDITTGSSGIAPANVSGLAATAGSTQVTVLWSDPADSVIEGVTLSKWAGSKLVRKEGAYPTDVTDGVLLVDNKTRDTYKTAGYVDTGLTNGTTYYYAVFPYSDSGAVNANEINRVSATPQAYVKYGVRWHKNQSSPALERTDDSASFTATATDEVISGYSDFDGKPIYKDLKICNVQNGAVTAYEGEAGFKRDGSNGDVMLEIPKFYYQVTDTVDYRDFVISDGPLDGFLVAPRHAPCDDYPNGLDKIYVGAYEASIEYKSISGAAPLVNLTRAQFRTGFTSRGAGYCQADLATQFEIQILYLVEFASLDSQSIVGNGNVNSSAAISTGGSDSVTGMTGCADKASQSIAVKYRGLENLWGNVNEWRDGINFNDGLIYVCTNPSKYADNTAAGYTNLAYSKIQTDGYISAIGLDASIPWAQLPTAAAGSDSTYLCDGYYYNPDWGVALTGGPWGGGSNAGLFYLNSSYNWTAYSDHIGSRLLILPES